MNRWTWLSVVAATALVVGCTSPPAESHDAGSTETDAGSTPIDAASAMGAAPTIDAAMIDAATIDAPPPVDAHLSDAGLCTVCPGFGCCGAGELCLSELPSGCVPASTCSQPCGINCCSPGDYCETSSMTCQSL